jgi:hypothetical protein
MPEDLILKIGKLPYWDPSGAIRLDALERVQQFWAKAGLVKKPAPIAAVADQKPLALARENK